MSENLFFSFSSQYMDKPVNCAIKSHISPYVWVFKTTILVKYNQFVIDCYVHAATENCLQMSKTSESVRNVSWVNCADRSIDESVKCLPNTGSSVFFHLLGAHIEVKINKSFYCNILGFYCNISPIIVAQKRIYIQSEFQSIFLIIVLSSRAHRWRA